MHEGDDTASVRGKKNKEKRCQHQPVDNIDRLISLKV